MKKLAAKTLGGKASYWGLALTTLLGLILTIAAFWAGRQSRLDALHFQLDRDAATRSQLIVQQLYEDVLITSSVRSLFEGSDRVSRYDFSHFANPLLANRRELLALCWIPCISKTNRLSWEARVREQGLQGFEFKERTPEGEVIRAGQRDCYYPLFYVAPETNADAMIGLDLGTDAAKRTALEQARDTGEPVLSERICPFGMQNGKYGLMLAIPVYRRSLPTGTVEERRAALSGFTVGIFQAEDLIAAALTSTPPIGVNIRLLDFSSESSKQQIHHWVSRNLGHDNWKTRLVSQVPQHLERFRCAKRNLGIEMTATRAFLERHFEADYWLVLPLGFLLTFTLVSHLRSMLTQQARMESMVHERTEELRSTNSELQAEIVQRLQAESALRENKQKLEKITTSAQDGIVLIDAEGKVTFWNEAAERILGYAASEILGQEFHPLIAPDRYQQAYRKNFSLFSFTGEGTVVDRNTELWAKRKDGKEVPVELSVSAVMLQGRWNAVGIMRDITQRKRTEQELQQHREQLEELVARRTEALVQTNAALQAEIAERRLIEKALKESEERFRNLVENTGDWIWETGESGVFAYVSPRVRDLLGYEPSDVLGKTPFELMPPEESRRATATLGPLLALHQPFRGQQIIYRHKHGHCVTLETSIVPIFDAQGIWCGYRGIDRDITERKQAEAEQHRAAEEIHDLYNRAPCGYHSLDESGVFRRVNDTELSWLGYSREELIGKKLFADLLTASSATRFAAGFAELKKGGALQDAEFEMLCKHGAPITVLLNATAVRDAAGKFLISRISMFDITRRKQAEAALAQERHLMRMLMENTPVRIYFKDLESRFIRANHAVAAQFGLKDPEEVVGKTDADFFSPAHAQRAMRDEQEIIRSGNPILNQEEEETWADRQQSWALTTKMPLRDPAGKIIGTFGLSRDITEGKLIDQKHRRVVALSLRTQEGLLQLTKLSSGDLAEFLRQTLALGVRTLMLEKAIFWWISEDCSEVAASEEYDCESGSHSQPRRFARAHYPQCFELLEAHRIIVIDDVQKDARAAELTATVFPSGVGAILQVPIRRDGRMVGVLSFLHMGGARNWDRVEQDFATSVSDLIVAALEADERRRAEDNLKKAMLDLERSNKELEQFAYVASHDLQEPLRLVKAYAQMLLERYRKQLDAEAEPILGFIEEGVSRMQRLIQDLLSYSRLGTQNTSFLLTDCERVLATALHNLSVAIQEQQAVVTHDPLPAIMGDETQLGQLFQNLIGNAIKFRGQTPPRVHLSAKKNSPSGPWEFSVQDNGIGIAPEYHERIFVIFQRLHSRRKYSGTGIGLAICKRIVERHGGQIWVESEPDKGSCFRFTLPSRPASSKDLYEHNRTKPRATDQHPPD